MSPRDVPARRRENRPRSTRSAGPARLVAVGALLAVAGVLAAIVLGSSGGGGSHPTTAAAATSSGSAKPASTTTASSGTPGTASVPVLAYHVINVAPASTSASQDLYVPADEFSAQMQALKAGGWHAVTLDQLQAYWSHGTSLGSGKPIVISFDGGYASQYTNALPSLKSLGWVGVFNIPLTRLSPSDGGLDESQIHGLIAGGWELGAQGGTDLSTSNPADLSSEVTTERDTLKTQYKVAVNWFAYPSTGYDSTFTTAVHAAGFAGGLTTVPGWANPKNDRTRLPRLAVVGGTSPSQLLSQITSAENDPAPPESSSGT